MKEMLHAFQRKSIGFSCKGVLAQESKPFQLRGRGFRVESLVQATSLSGIGIETPQSHSSFKPVEELK